MLTFSQCETILGERVSKKMENNTYRVFQSQPISKDGWQNLDILEDCLLMKHIPEWTKPNA